MFTSRYCLNKHLLVESDEEARLCIIEAELECDQYLQDMGVANEVGLDQKFSMILAVAVDFASPLGQSAVQAVKSQIKQLIKWAITDSKNDIRHEDYDHRLVMNTKASGMKIVARIPTQSHKNQSLIDEIADLKPEEDQITVDQIAILILNLWDLDRRRKDYTGHLTKFGIEDMSPLFTSPTAKPDNYVPWILGDR